MHNPVDGSFLIVVVVLVVVVVVIVIFADVVVVFVVGIVLFAKSSVHRSLSGAMRESANHQFC